MTAMGLDGSFLMSTISLGIVWLMIVVICIGRLRADPVYWVMLVGTILVGVVIFSKIGEESSRVYSVSGTVTEVSDVLWDSDGEPFTEVKLD